MPVRPLFLFRNPEKQDFLGLAYAIKSLLTSYQAPFREVRVRQQFTQHAFAAFAKVLVALKL